MTLNFEVFFLWPKVVTINLAKNLSKTWANETWKHIIHHRPLDSILSKLVKCCGEWTQNANTIDEIHIIADCLVVSPVAWRVISSFLAYYHTESCGFIHLWTTQLVILFCIISTHLWAYSAVSAKNTYCLFVVLICNKNQTNRLESLLSLNPGSGNSL